MLCEICGNEFNKRMNLNKEGKFGVNCPYCKSFNEKKGFIKKEKHSNKKIWGENKR